MLKQHKSDQMEGNYGKMEAHWDGEFLLVAARGGRGDGGQSQVLSSTSSTSSSSSTTSVSISLLACHSPPSWIFFWTTGIGFKYFWVISNHVSTSSRIISSSCHCHVSLRYSHFLLQEESPDWSDSEPDQTIGEWTTKPKDHCPPLLLVVPQIKPHSLISRRDGLHLDKSGVRRVISSYLIQAQHHHNTESTKGHWPRQ